MKIDYAKFADKIKFWKNTIENVKNFVGTSPPSIFVGRYGYPKVYVGILAPPRIERNAEIFDFPERWYEEKRNIFQIIDLRAQMIYSRFKSCVRKSNKLCEIVKELAMAKKETNVEISLKKKPRFALSINKWIRPIANPAPIEKAKIAENVKVVRKVEKVVDDADLKAKDAVWFLYKNKISVSKIQKIFSAGLLGLKIERKFVPTRWSITAIDYIISNNLMEKIIEFDEIDEIRVYSNEYVGNHYEILLVPNVYQFELVEVWDMKEPKGGSDYENYFGRKEYAFSTGGAFYAAKLACLEFLEKIKKQASILVIREVRDEYFLPVGIWQLRECIRDAFNKNYQKFYSLEKAINEICKRLITKNFWINKSRLLKILKTQTKIKQFIS